VAQGLKVLFHLAIEGRLDLRYLASAGGMPSSHSAFAASLATAVAIQDGLRSPLFAVAAAFAIVVMFDAQGVRQATSVQARILNQIIDELFQGHPISEERLRELIGHTPVEVFVGAALGIVLTRLWM
jgi:hypothetical protein